MPQPHFRGNRNACERHLAGGGNGDYDSLYQELIVKRVDGAYTNTRIARYYWTKIRKANHPPVEYASDLPHASGQWYVASIRHPKLGEEFKHFMVSNRQEVEELKKRYPFVGSEDQ